MEQKSRLYILKYIIEDLLNEKVHTKLVSGNRLAMISVKDRKLISKYLVKLSAPMWMIDMFLSKGYINSDKMNRVYRLVLERTTNPVSFGEPEEIRYEGQSEDEEEESSSFDEISSSEAMLNPFDLQPIQEASLVEVLTSLIDSHNIHSLNYNFITPGKLTVTYNIPTGE